MTTTPLIEPAAPDAEPAQRMFLLVEVMSWIEDQQPPKVEYPPSRMVCTYQDQAGRSVVEIQMRSMLAVGAWAAALGFGPASTTRSETLKQTVVEATGEVFGWCVELRHVHTDPAPLARTGVQG